MYKDIFLQLGLNLNEATVYEFLLTNGESPAGLIIKKTPLKRGVVYNALTGLIQKELINSKTKNKIAFFCPNHPEKLREYAQQKEKEFQKAEKNLSANMPDLISNFNLVSDQPGIRYFEGLDGVKKVLMDTLLDNPKKEILTFSDIENYSKYLSHWNAQIYAPKRRALGINEKAILPKTATATKFIKEYMKNPQAQELTEVLFVEPELLPPFSTETNIYSDKVSFVTFSEKGHVGMIIQNQEIVKTLTSIFNYTWKLGKADTQLAAQTN